MLFIETNLNQNGSVASSFISENSNTGYKFKLIYFEDRGKADLIKLLFYLGKQTYEAIQIKQTEWTYYKSFMPFEQLPVLIINEDFKLAQPNTICRFLANILKLNGKTELNIAYINSFREKFKTFKVDYFEVLI